ncbi:MAG: DUF4345 domain-containing protein [Bacteroidota bacterium]
MIRHLHLTISATIIIPVGLMYGLNPSSVLLQVFGFEVQDLELKNIFRATMGLYLAFGAYWLFGAYKKSYWRGATISNVLFMGGLAVGRLVSTAIDGVSEQFIVGLLAELLLMYWGLRNLKKAG